MRELAVCPKCGAKLNAKCWRGQSRATANHIERVRLAEQLDREQLGVGAPRNEVQPAD